MPLYFARRSGFGYGEVAELDREQIVELKGHRNDEKLVRLGYLAEVPSHSTLCPCGVCGEQFLTPSTLNAHGRKRHPDRFNEVTPAEEDRLRAEEERINESVAPLYLDQTEASRKDGPTTVISSPKPAAPVADPPKRKRGRPPKQRVQPSA